MDKSSISLTLGRGRAEFPMEKGSFTYIDHISGTKAVPADEVLFEETQEGLESAVAWINEQYESRKDEWNKIF